MENLAQLAPLIILFPAIGAFINFFWGARMGEKPSAIVATVAAASSFVISVMLLLYLTNNNYQPVVVDPPLLDSWIRIDSVNLDIAWQTRVDTLSVSMMMFVTLVGTLIHIYAIGYMHGDSRFSRFFAYLNMFLVFMLILVSGNNLLMMFVGWEGVGLCSYLLIGFWWDKPNGVGWKNSNAARKAFIANRIGDFGVLMAIFLVWWSFGTLDFYKPGEVANPSLTSHSVEAEAVEGEDETATVTVAEPEISYQNPEIEDSQLGIFGQAQRLVDRSKAGEDVQLDIGPFTFEITTLLVIVTLFMLLGATGKSAQIPLFVWLPDAMAGPTPVSALIHAATMVTAGVYMMVRTSVFFYNAELTSFIVAMVGAGTAVVAGFVAIAQFDIKRVLAYSTISQLGFMVAAVGLGAYPAAMFHMITHAFFKALLFLGSGSVIHGVEHGHHHVHEHDGHGEEPDPEDHAVVTTHQDEKAGQAADDFDPQDMRNMGGLRSRMPVTYWTYLVGTLALAGIWPLAGFWSKDEILADAWMVGFEKGRLEGYLALGLLMLAAVFTAFYMWRQVVMVFHGSPRTEAAAHAPESVRTMTIPLVILAVFSVFIGFINIPTGAGVLHLGMEGIFGKHALADFIEYSVGNFVLPPFTLFIALGATALGIGAILMANSIYGNDRAVTKHRRDPLEINPSFGTFWALAHGRLYWDEIYDRLFITPFSRAADFLANTIDWIFLHDYFHDSVLVRGYRNIGKLLSKPVDLGIIDGAVNGVGWLVRQFSSRLRTVQTGYVRTYAVALLIGVVAIIVIMLLPLINIG